MDMVKSALEIQAQVVEYTSVSETESLSDIHEPLDDPDKDTGYVVELTCTEEDDINLEYQIAKKVHKVQLPEGNKLLMLQGTLINKSI